MLKLKHSLTATAALLVTLAGTAAAQSQEQKKTDKTEPPQDVKVTNVVPTHPGVPPGAFSVFQLLGAGFGPILNPEAQGTGFAITSFTVANNSFSSISVSLSAYYGTTSDCINFSGPASAQYGPVVKVPAGETLHLTFPQPVILPAQSGAASCLAWASTGNANLYVVGYRLPLAAPQPQQ